MEHLKDFIEHLKVVWFANSYAKMVVALGIILLTILVNMLFVKVFNRFIRRRTDDMQNDPTNYKFLRHAIVALIYTVGLSAAIYTIPSLRALASSLLAGAGILAVAVGFASQKALSNLISGIFIIMFKPFRVNDRVSIRGTISGVVEDISLRHTVIRNFENRRVIIPNSIIGDEVLVNADFQDALICKWLDMGIGYRADYQLAKKIIQEEAMKHPFFLDKRTPEEKAEGVDAVRVRVLNWGDFSINIRAWIWTADNGSAFQLGCDLYESIKERFDAEGVEIPYPYRNVVHHNLPQESANVQEREHNVK
jgi:small-conductance mechanosensitive channel